MDVFLKIEEHRFLDSLPLNMTPDIVLVTVDSLRYDAICNEDGAIEPNLKGFRRIADSGVSYSNAWATGPYTRVSVPAIISGSYQWSYEGPAYEEARPHLAEMFKEQGYATGGFHSNPFLDGRFSWDRGFDRYFSATGSSDRNSLRARIREFALERNVTKRLGRGVMSRVGRYAGIDLRDEPYLPAEQLNEEVIEWVAEQSSSVFLWVHYMDVHNPWYPRKGTVSADIDPRTLTRTFYKARLAPETVTENERELLRRGYQGSVQHFDEMLEGLLEDLEEHLSDPVICLTSDHGELFGEGGAYFHPGRLNEELVRVPLLFSEEATLMKKSSPVSTVDIFPTLRKLVDGVSSTEVDGHVLQKESTDRSVFAAGENRIRVVSDQINKIYDINNVTAASLSETDREMLAKLYSEENGIDQFADNDLTEQLEALGYR